MQEQIDQINDQIKIAIPSEEDVKRELCKRSNLRARLAQKKVLLNTTIGKTSALKVRIDVLRQDLLFAHQSINAMKE